MNYLQDDYFGFHKDPTLVWGDCCYVWCPDFSSPKIAVKKKSERLARKIANEMLKVNSKIQLENLSFLQKQWGKIQGKGIEDERSFPPSWEGIEKCWVFEIEIEIVGFVPINLFADFCPNNFKKNTIDQIFINYGGLSWEYNSQKLKMIYNGKDKDTNIFRDMSLRKIQTNIRKQLKGLYNKKISDFENYEKIRLFDLKYYNKVL